MILLDTCALYWAECDQVRLSDAARGALEDPAAVVHASAISAFELGLKIRDGQLRLPLSAAAWVREVCARRSFRLLPLDVEAAGRATELPPLHKDPCDRFLVATALGAGLRIVTPDENIRKYPGLGVVW